MPLSVATALAPGPGPSPHPVAQARPLPPWLALLVTAGQGHSHVLMARSARGSWPASRGSSPAVALTAQVRSWLMAMILA